MVKSSVYWVAVGVLFLSSAGCRGLLRSSAVAVTRAEERSKKINSQQSFSGLLLDNKQDTLLTAARKVVSKHSLGDESRSEKGQNLTEQQIIDQATKTLIFKMANTLDDQPISKKVLSSVRLQVLDIKKAKPDSRGDNVYLATIIISNTHPVAIKSFEAQVSGWSPKEPLKTKWFGYVSGGNGKDTFVEPISSKKVILPVLDLLTHFASSRTSSKRELGWVPRFPPPTTKNVQIDSHTIQVNDGNLDYGLASTKTSFPEEIYNYLNAVRRMK